MDRSSCNRSNDGTVVVNENKHDIRRVERRCIRWELFSSEKRSSSSQLHQLIYHLPQPSPQTTKQSSCLTLRTPPLLPTRTTPTFLDLARRTSPLLSKPTPIELRTLSTPSRLTLMLNLSATRRMPLTRATSLRSALEVLPSLVAHTRNLVMRRVFPLTMERALSKQILRRDSDLVERVCV